jgi:hypothetical protein
MVFYFESTCMIILPYAGRVIITPTSTPMMVIIANPLSVDRSINNRGSIAITTVAAATMIILSALESRFR